MSWIVEIAPGGNPADPSTWNFVNVTEFLAPAPITIETGERDEGQEVDSAELSLTFDNTGGQFSARNPLGPWFGKLARNTPIRVRREGAVRERFVGFVAEWPVRWDQSGGYSTAPIKASGILRRLRQGDAAKPLQSAPRRMIPTTDPVAYWPLTDGEDSTSAAPVVGRHYVRTRRIQPRWSAASPAAWLESFPEIASGTRDGRLEGRVDMGDFAGEWAIGALWIPRDASSSTNDMAGVCTSLPSGEQLVVGVYAGTGDELEVYRFSEGLEGSSSYAPIGFVNAPGIHNGDPHWVELRVWQDGSTLRTAVYMDGENLGFKSGGSASLTLSRLERVYILGLDGDAFGHLAVWDSFDNLDDVAGASLGYRGEPAGRRIERLAAETGIPATVIGDADDSVPMGPQRPSSFLDLVRECVEADGGLLFEDGPGLGYVTRTARYNPEPSLTLDVGKGEFAAAPEPTDDDQQIVNEVTAARVDGSAVTVSDASSIDREGLYDKAVRLNVDADHRLGDLAGWRVHLGTVEEMRWPRIPIDLATNPHLIDDWLAFPMGGRLVASHEVSQIPGVPIDVLVVGWTETIDRDGEEWSVALNCVPASPWRVAVYDDEVLGRYDTEGSATASAISETATEIEVESVPGSEWIDSAGYGGEFPFDVLLAGEVCRVLAVSGTGATQTFTVERAVNGVSKPHPAGTSVSLATPAVLAL